MQTCGRTLPFSREPYCVRTFFTETWPTTIAPDAVSRELLRSSILAPWRIDCRWRRALPVPSCPAGGRAKRKPDPGVRAPLGDRGFAGLGSSPAIVGAARDADGPAPQPLSRTDW